LALFLRTTVIVKSRHLLWTRHLSTINNILLIWARHVSCLPDRNIAPTVNVRVLRSAFYTSHRWLSSGAKLMQNLAVWRKTRFAIFIRWRHWWRQWQSDSRSRSFATSDNSRLAKFRARFAPSA